MKEKRLVRYVKLNGIGLRSNYPPTAHLATVLSFCQHGSELLRNSEPDDLPWWPWEEGVTWLPMATFPFPHLPQVRDESDLLEFDAWTAILFRGEVVGYVLRGFAR